MKILLVGEFSALHKNLKEGLLELGHDVKIASNGDGWKKIDSDIRIGSTREDIFGKISRVISPYINYKEFSNNDVVQLVNPFVFNDYININFTKFLKSNNKNLFLVAAGTDCYYIKQQKEYRYSPYNQLGVEDKIAEYEDLKKININKQVVDIVDGVIPIMYDYAEAYRMNNKLKKTIPIPMNCNLIKYDENIVKDKIVIFHGLNREWFKGTEIIKQALEEVKERYPSDIEVIIDGNMPLDKYLQTIKRANIIIDQCRSYSYGVNAVYSMAQGKVVMSGAEQECLNEFGIDKTPIINITPDKNNIINQITNLIENRHKIYDIGVKSREYVEEMHDYIKVARMYCDSWDSK